VIDIDEHQSAAAFCEVAGNRLANAVSRSSDHGDALHAKLHVERSQARSARTGSMRVARQAGRKHATNATSIITIKADTNAIGSRGLTL